MNLIIVYKLITQTVAGWTEAIGQVFWLYVVKEGRTKLPTRCLLWGGPINRFLGEIITPPLLVSDILLTTLFFCCIYNFILKNCFILFRISAYNKLATTDGIDLFHEIKFPPLGEIKCPPLEMDVSFHGKWKNCFI